MEAVLEGIATLAAIAIYGTEDKPRHPALRNLVRIIAFGGLPVAYAKLIFWPEGPAVPVVLTAAWLFVSVVFMLAEVELGSKRLALVLLTGLALCLGLALYVEYG